MKYVNRIDSGVVESLERKLSVLQQYFEHGVQKVLVLGKKVAVPQKVRGYFDSVLFAEDVFL